MFLADRCFQIPPSRDLLFLLGEGRPTPQRSICSFPNAPVSLLFFFFFSFRGEGEGTKLKSRVCFLYNVSLKFIPFLPYATHSLETTSFISIFPLLKKIQINPASRTKWSPMQGGISRPLPLCCGVPRCLFAKSLPSLGSRNESAAPAHSRALQERT